MYLLSTRCGSSSLQTPSVFNADQTRVIVPPRLQIYCTETSIHMSPRNSRSPSGRLNPPSRTMSLYSPQPRKSTETATSCSLWEKTLAQLTNFVSREIRCVWLIQSGALCFLEMGSFPRLLKRRSPLPMTIQTHYF